MKMKNTPCLALNHVSFAFFVLLIFVLIASSGSQEGEGCGTGYTQVPYYQNQMYSGCVPNEDLVPNCSKNQFYFDQNQNQIIVCVACDLGYILLFQQNQCMPLVQNCSHYVNLKCINCIGGLNLTYVANQGQKCVPNTLSCSSGYRLINDTCQPIIKCSYYYYYNSVLDECVPGYIPNCLIYGEEGLTCIQCSDGYTVNQTSALNVCQKNMPICPPPTNATKFVTINYTCIKVDINCLYYLDDGSCYDCLSGFYQYQGNCLPNSTTPTPPIVCSPDYILMGTICVKRAIPITPVYLPSNPQCPCFDVCVIYDYVLNVCTKCATGYQPELNYCISIQQPGQCLNDRQWPGGQDKRCIQISQTCQTFVKETGQCTSCYDPYILVSPGVCGYGSSLPCKDGFAQISGNRCVPAVNNCKTYSQITGKCLTCQYGYSIIVASGICIKLN